MIKDEDLKSSIDYSEGQKEAAHRILVELVNIFKEYEDDIRIHFPFACPSGLWCLSVPLRSSQSGCPLDILRPVKVVCGNAPKVQILPQTYWSRRRFGFLINWNLASSLYHFVH